MRAEEEILDDVQGELVEKSVVIKKAVVEAEDKTDAVKKVNIETTPLKKPETEATASKNVDPARIPHASSEMSVKISEPK
ncbi:hypothetical protein KI688_004262 [Linnemannia hyalina]|uniref:Uncharacterized protein n=1 Tax=Linnemannia hyalina TaxID=64524 RepID=A0A9P7XLC3_9FUNG|nr:hypothetical protein KI688_004262 [Linnemannia hyalina]